MTNIFWAKTTPEGVPGISVYEHMIDVGCVAKCLAELSPTLLNRFQFCSPDISALAALHDLGKISPGFQRKCELWLEENGLTIVDRNGCWDTKMERDHGKVSHAEIQNFLVSQGCSRNSAMYFATILGAHHGRLKFLPNNRGIKPPLIRQITDNVSTISWDEERQKNARDVWNYFKAGTPEIAEDSPALWWLAGLTTVADWIGSNELYFPPDSRVDIRGVSELAHEALAHIGFRQNEIIPGLSFHELFYDKQYPEIKWEPNEMQAKTVGIINEPGVYVVEAPMGMGKTEAALWAAYLQLTAGRATGIYFALPTQVTSNRIHLRLNSFLQRITSEAESSRLIHGNSWLMDKQCLIAQQGTGEQAGMDWFSSAKRALLAPFGVGTIDQALLGVVAAKHFFVRHFALAGKVVILDEIHSYDLYTSTLIDKLITTLEGLGCTVIVLSATLTGERRGKIVSLSEDMADEGKLPYPLISGRVNGEVITPVAANPPKARIVKVDFIDTSAAENEAVSLARLGGAVLWICDTVDSAQKQFNKLQALLDDEIPIGLLHSRFPFWRREDLENEWMGRFGKDGKTRCGAILVSTQVVEQSVDLDADLLITELAPTDMLLQRLGRLWRHERPERPLEQARLCIINEKIGYEKLLDMDAKGIINSLGGKAYVYYPYVLLRTLQLWQRYDEVVIPAQIRELIEATYNVVEDEPKAWEQLRDDEQSVWDQLFDDRFIQDSNKRFLAELNSNYWQESLPDVEGCQTRLNEIPTVAMVLCRTVNEQEIQFVDESVGRLDRDKFVFSIAQAIHRNLVKIPKYCFVGDRIEPYPAFTRYLFGDQCLGLVTSSGQVEIQGIKDEYKLLYSDQSGLVIRKISEQEEI